MSKQGPASDHIASDRLRVIAKDRDVFFTNIEFLHMQVCRTCFNVWLRYLEEDNDGQQKNEP